ncbi:Cyclic nucleotide-gated cation channel subunit A [Diplonema papillatum]|nr:Cyclic nucleotide-gated cation channel subunit A [Diplonema papillatum]
MAGSPTHRLHPAWGDPSAADASPHPPRLTPLDALVRWLRPEGPAGCEQQPLPFAAASFLCHVSAALAVMHTVTALAAQGPYTAALAFSSVAGTLFSAAAYSRTGDDRWLSSCVCAVLFAHPVAAFFRHGCVSHAAGGGRELLLSALAIPFAHLHRAPPPPPPPADNHLGDTPKSSSTCDDNDAATYPSDAPAEHPPPPGGAAPAWVVSGLAVVGGIVPLVVEWAAYPDGCSTGEPPGRNEAIAGALLEYTVLVAILCLGVRFAKIAWQCQPVVDRGGGEVVRRSEGSLTLQLNDGAPIVTVPAAAQRRPSDQRRGVYRSDTIGLVSTTSSRSAASFPSFTKMESTASLRCGPDTFGAIGGGAAKTKGARRSSLAATSDASSQAADAETRIADFFPPAEQPAADDAQSPPALFRRTADELPPVLLSVGQPQTGPRAAPDAKPPPYPPKRGDAGQAADPMDAAAKRSFPTGPDSSKSPVPGTTAALPPPHPPARRGTGGGGDPAPAEDERSKCCELDGTEPCEAPREANPPKPQAAAAPAMNPAAPVPRVVGSRAPRSSCFGVLGSTNSLLALQYENDVPPEALQSLHSLHSLQSLAPAAAENRKEQKYLSASPASSENSSVASYESGKWNRTHSYKKLDRASSQLSQQQQQQQQLRAPRKRSSGSTDAGLRRAYSKRLSDGGWPGTEVESDAESELGPADNFESVLLPLWRKLELKAQGAVGEDLLDEFLEACGVEMSWSNQSMFYECVVRRGEVSAEAFISKYNEFRLCGMFSAHHCKIHLQAINHALNDPSFQRLVSKLCYEKDAVTGTGTLSQPVLIEVLTHVGLSTAEPDIDNLKAELNATSTFDISDIIALCQCSSELFSTEIAFPPILQAARAVLASRKQKNVYKNQDQQELDAIVLARSRMEAKLPVVWFYCFFTFCITSVNAVFNAEVSLSVYIVFLVSDFVYFLWAAERIMLPIEDNGLLVTDRRLILKHYFTSWEFVVDLVVCFPGDYIALISGLKSRSIMRANKCGTLFHLNYLYRTVCGRYSPVVARMGHAFYWLVLQAHMVGCVFKLVANIVGDPNIAISLTIPNYSELNTLLQYSQGFDYAIKTMSGLSRGVPIPATDLQILLAFYIVFTGVVTYAVLLATISNALQMPTQEGQFRERVNEVRGFMQYSKLPEAFQTDCVAYYRHVFNTTGSYRIDVNLLDDLPPELDTVVRVEMCSQIISKVPIFADAAKNDEFVFALSLKLQNDVISPGQVVTVKGQTGSNMYFITHGSCGITTDTGEITFTLRAGNFFGEIALLHDVKRTATILALEFCNVLTLDKSDFEEVTGVFPEALNSIKEAAKERIMLIISQEREKKEQQKRQLREAQQRALEIKARRASAVSAISSLTASDASDHDSQIGSWLSKRKESEASATPSGRSSVCSYSTIASKKRLVTDTWTPAGARTGPRKTFHDTSEPPPEQGRQTPSRSFFNNDASSTRRRHMADEAGSPTKSLMPSPSQRSRKSTYSTEKGPRHPTFEKAKDAKQAPDGSRSGGGGGEEPVGRKSRSSSYVVESE